MRVTKAACGAECWTDHRLIISKLSLRIQPKQRPQGRQAPKRVNISKLNLLSTKKEFVASLEVKLNDILLEEQDVEAAWSSLRDTIYNTAMECLGPCARRHQDWFDENHTEIMGLMEKKRAAHLALLSDPNSTSKKRSFKEHPQHFPAKVA